MQGKITLITIADVDCCGQCSNRNLLFQRSPVLHLIGSRGGSRITATWLEVASEFFQSRKGYDHLPIRSRYRSRSAGVIVVFAITKVFMSPTAAVVSSVVGRVRVRRRISDFCYRRSSIQIYQEFDI